jgi:hypothetical protein
MGNSGPFRGSSRLRTRYIYGLKQIGSLRLCFGGMFAHAPFWRASYPIRSASYPRSASSIVCGSTATRQQANGLWRSLPRLSPGTCWSDGNAKFHRVACNDSSGRRAGSDPDMLFGSHLEQLKLNEPIDSRILEDAWRLEQLLNLHQ